MKFPWHPRSVRTYLLLWIISPIAIFIVFDTVTLYLSTLESANIAYDRMLVTTAHSIGDELSLENDQLQVSVSYAKLEVYEAGYFTRMIYRVNDEQGNFIVGDGDLPPYHPKHSVLPKSPSLLSIYQSTYGDAPVRVVAIYQPIISGTTKTGAVIQVAEPMSFRTTVADRVLRGTLIRQALLLAIVATVTMIVVTRALRPLESLKQQLDDRREEDLAPLSAPSAPRELQSVITALNQLMFRLHRLLGLQQRFVADASHQLRTPLAVLKTQLQSGLRGDAPPEGVMSEMAGRVDRATSLANQLLSLAKVEQLRGKGIREPCDLPSISREIAIDLSPLISEKNLDFELETVPACVSGNRWMVGEMISNLMNNAIRHTPAEGKLGIRIEETSDAILLHVWDTGSGMPHDLESRVFEPFAASYATKGGGLGLTICAEIADSMQAGLHLRNRIEDGKVAGLDAMVQFRKERPPLPQ